jgi:hypothetical protein
MINRVHQRALTSKDHQSAAAVLGTQRPSEDIEGGVLWDPRDRVKAGLLEAQYPCGATSPPTGTMSVTGVASCVDLGHSVDATSMARAMSKEDIQGCEWATYLTLDTYIRDVPRDRLRGASPTATEGQ